MEELRANSNFASQLPFKKEILENPNFLGQFSSMTGIPRNPNLSQLPFMNEILVDSKFSTQLLSMTEIPRNPNFSTQLSSMAESPRTPNFSTQLPSMAEIPRNPHLSQLSSTMTEILVNPNSSTQLPPNGHYNGEATTPFLGSFSSCHSQHFTEWSWEEHDACERAYLSVPEGVPNRWELIAAQIPSKSTAEVINYCIALLQDLMRLRQMQSPESTVAPRTLMNLRNGDPARNKKRKKREPWTKEEHILFLRGLKKHGKGDWKSISRYMEFSKTPAQIASHAQKFFLRPNKRQYSNRSSIHDITTVDDDNDDKAVTLVYQSCHNYTPR